MVVSLNFSKDEIPKIVKVLESEGSEEKGTNTEYELKRVVRGKSTVILYTSGKVVIQNGAEEAVKEWLLSALGLKEELVLGIDETGRGEGTGPFVIAAVLADRNKMRELRDSKKIDKGNLDAKYVLVMKNAKASAAVSVEAEDIDKLRGRGQTMDQIEAQIIDDIVKAMGGAGKGFPVRVDGSSLPVKSKGVEFVVKGDDLDPVIGAASVLAKYTREKSEDKGERKSWKNSK